MSKANDLARLLNASGELQAADIEDGVITAAKLASTLDLSGKTVTLPSGVGGKVLQVVGTNFNDTHGVSVVPSLVTITTAYNNSGLTPMMSASITPMSSTSYFYVTLSGGFSLTTSYRCQILLTRNYTPGTNAYSAGNYIWHDHYGIFNNTGGDLYTPGSFSYMDKSQDQVVGSSRTYYWFGGIIGSGTQTLRGGNVSVMEIEV